VFGAEPADGDLERWSALFRTDPFAYEAIVREWFLSPDYERVAAVIRPKTDHMWIRSLFIDLLGRKPSFAEYRNFRNAVQALSDSSPVRSVLTKVILDSGQVALPDPGGKDARPFVEETFRRYLCRPPTAAEFEVFLAALASPGGGPKTVVQAILSSDEYQHY
jgi:hypothetical protein